MSMTSHPLAFGTIEHTERAGELLGELAKAVESYAANAERFRWLAEHTVATGLTGACPCGLPVALMPDTRSADGSASKGSP